MSNSNNFPARQAPSGKTPTQRFVGLPEDLNRRNKTPQTTIEAVLYAVRDRGLEALKEPANIARLSTCDETAKTEINERIARLLAAREIAA
jgi:hypothetical protein